MMHEKAGLTRERGGDSPESCLVGVHASHTRRLAGLVDTLLTRAPASAASDSDSLRRSWDVHEAGVERASIHPDTRCAGGWEM